MLPADASSKDLQTQTAYIASNLKACITALGTNQADAVICMLF